MLLFRLSQHEFQQVHDPIVINPLGDFVDSDTEGSTRPKAAGGSHHDLVTAYHPPVLKTVGLSGFNLSPAIPGSLFFWCEGKRNGGKVCSAVRAQVCALWDVLSQQPVSVLVCSTLPWTAWIAEMDL